MPTDQLLDRAKFLLCQKGNLPVASFWHERQREATARSKCLPYLCTGNLPIASLCYRNLPVTSFCPAYRQIARSKFLLCQQTSCSCQVSAMPVGNFLVASFCPARSKFLLQQFARNQFLPCLRNKFLLQQFACSKFLLQQFACSKFLLQQFARRQFLLQEFARNKFHPCIGPTDNLPIANFCCCHASRQFVSSKFLPCQ